MATPKSAATSAGPADDPNMRRALDPQEVIRLGKIVVDPAKTDAEQKDAATRVLAQYGIS